VNKHIGSHSLQRFGRTTYWELAHSNGQKPKSQGQQIIHLANAAE